MAISYRQELYRKLIHLCSLSIPIGYHLFGKHISITVLIFTFLIAAYIDLTRIWGLPGKAFFKKLIGPVLRDHEHKGFSGAFYILLAGLLAICFLDIPEAAAVMGFVILGDVSAALIGRKWGHVRLPGTHKTLEGSIAFFTTCLFVVGVAPGINTGSGLAGAFTATIAEAYSMKLDDNLVVVILAGIVMLLF